MHRSFLLMVFSFFVISCSGGGGGGGGDTLVAPVAVISSSSGSSALSINFNGTLSIDADGSIVIYNWDFGDGSTSTLAAPIHIYSAAGTYDVILTVTDDSGATATSNQTVNVSPSTASNIAPVAAPRFSLGDNALNIHFDGDYSIDSDGFILDYSWDFGDGNNAEGSQVSHTFAMAGTYSIQLTVTDDQGSSNTLARNITMNPSVSDDIDPLFSAQWHLNNTGQAGNNGLVATVDEDLNVLFVWNTCGDGITCRGEGVVTAIVDDGLEIAHEDLIDNVLVGESFNYLNNTSDPTPSTANSGYAHGTAVGGIVAANDKNNIGVRGVAPRSQLVGYNALQTQENVDTADAMSRGIGIIDISNNSWGPLDDTAELSDSNSLWRASIDNGVTTGRDNKGIVYVWAAGNGDRFGDNSNYDGFANYPNVLAIGAVNAQGTRSSYSELGANVLVAGTGGEFCSTLAITTTDLSSSDGYNTGASLNETSNTNYTQCMNGTSAAAPSVAGVVALMLQANPALTWRDVRRILADTARRNDSSDSDWVQNGAGKWVNHQYGFGVVDAAAAVAAASSWTNLPAQQTMTTSTKTVNIAIADNNSTGITDTINVTGSGINNIEFVQIEFSASDHGYAGDLQIELTSPDGTISQLAERRVCNPFDPDPFINSECLERYSAWDFGSVRHTGESADGIWQLKVVDAAAADTGTFQSWKLTFHGY